MATFLWKTLSSKLASAAYVFRLIEACFAATVLLPIVNSPNKNYAYLKLDVAPLHPIPCGRHEFYMSNTFLKALLEHW